ncbi:hypothetical protein BKA67DRAFT_261489 [Truncatella angustata]|uniref:Uncharacterized protein n=1 Tax=Truncatella angustata TaxID=152316 RepID=A0A9P8ZXB8_9PEZI|nr:uncharacterized protein BKA67DRAFT_261489 [Truncatella angustata]KAH6653824.1 hypothetical protein BKA67DRAFT_261489 [Truncatella angustata]KAH8197588.1 hypothetical protein TruAng_008272 [Truncatella angustata]
MIGSHRDQSQFDRARWRKRVLLPCWIIQIPILLALMGVFSYRLSNTVKTFKEEKAKGGLPMVEFVWEIVNITFSAVSFIIDLVQIAKFIAEALTPFGMLFGNTVSLTLSMAILALDVVVYVQHTEKQYSLIALSLDCALLFFTIVPIIYGIHVYRRIAKDDEYAHPHNVKHYGFTQPQDGPYDPSRMSLSHDPESHLYDPANPPEGKPRRPSLTFRRSLSGTSIDHRTPSASPHPRPEMERRPSYDHKRDPSFDEYVATIPKEALQAPRSRGNSLTHPASWELNMGDSLDTPVGGTQLGHSLVAVPEAREEDDVGVPRRKSRPVSEDRQGLLSSSNPRTSAQSFASYASRSSRVEPVQGLQDVELDTRKRRRDS